MKRIRFDIDALGVCASGLCMIHCLAFPLLLATLAALRVPAGADHPAASGGSILATPAQQEQADDDTCSETECCPVVDGRAADQSEIETAATPEHAACCANPTDFWIHLGLLAAVAPLGMLAWTVGYRRHRCTGVLWLGLVGVILLSGALLFGSQVMEGRGEQVMTVSGSIVMVSAHLWNRRECRCCRVADESCEVKTMAPDA